MSLFIEMDVQDTIVSCKGTTIEEAYNAAVAKAEELNALGNYAVLDDFGLCIKNGMCAWNVLVKKRNYR